MSARSLAALVLLNVVLLAGVLTVALPARPAAGQMMGGRQYTMISGMVDQDDDAVVYILNLQTSQMVAVQYESNRNRLQLMGRRTVADDLTLPFQGGR